MKILIIKEYNPYHGSNARNNRLRSLINGLLDENAEVDLFVAAPSEHLDLNYPSKLNVIFLSKSNVKSSLIAKIINKVVFLHPTLIYKRIREKMVKEYDCIWLDRGKTMTLVGLKMMKMKKHYFFQEMGEFSWIGFDTRYSMYSQKKIHEIYINEFIPGLNSMAVISNTLGEYYKEFNPTAKLLHLPMTVEMSRFDLIKKESSVDYVGYCGTLNCKKDGVDILVRSFIKIMDDFPNLELRIAGPLTPVTDYHTILNIINKSNAIKRVKLLGLYDRNEIPSFLKNSKLLALSRPKSKQAEGGFPTKLGEYLATGVPVCVTNVGEITQYLTHKESAYIAEPNSVKSFADVMRMALENPDSKKVGNNGKIVAENQFSSKVQSKRLYKFLGTI